jgi:hypothetical protein
LAITAFAACPADPGNAYPRSWLETLNAFPRFDDAANNLVSRNKWQFGMEQLTIKNVEIGSADRAGADANQDLAGADGRADHAFFTQQRPRWLQDHSLHHRQLITLESIHDKGNSSASGSCPFRISMGMWLSLLKIFPRWRKGHHS